MIAAGPDACRQLVASMFPGAAGLELDKRAAGVAAGLSASCAALALALDAGAPSAEALALLGMRGVPVDQVAASTIVGQTLMLAAAAEAVTAAAGGSPLAVSAAAERLRELAARWAAVAAELRSAGN